MNKTFRGAGRCPRCGCRKVRRCDMPVDLSRDFYGRTLEICVNCKAAWEPFDPAQIWDATDPMCSFRDPCDNCAFRRGSPEQRNKERWAEIMDGLKSGASFHCHKGVPIDPGGEHGFAYPHDRDGRPIRSKLRLCRGYLNMLASWADHQILANTDATLPVRITDDA